MRAAHLILAMAVMPIAATAEESSFEWKPPHVQFKFENGCRDIPRETVRIGDLPITKEPKELDQRLGKTEWHPTWRKDREYYNWGCWKSANGDGTVLLVESWEMSATISVIGAEVPFQHRATCTPSKLVRRDMATGNGIHLGMKRADVVGKVGAATAQGDDWFLRGCSTERQLTRAELRELRIEPVEEKVYLNSFFAGVEHDGRLVAFQTDWYISG